MSIFLCLYLLASIHAPTVPSFGVDRACLAVVAYTEARGEGVAGMAAVDYVVLERARDAKHRWPSTICAVSMQRGQFSGVDNWNPQRIERDSWFVATTVADWALDHRILLVPRPCVGATFFDTHGNTRDRVVLCKIGNHTFYKAK